MTLPKVCLVGSFLLTAAFGQTPFVSPEFAIPTLYQTKTYKLVPLGPEVVKQDYDAYMSSIEHLQKTFSNGKWPTRDISMTDAMKDMENEATRFRERKSFAYSVLTLDGLKELGSVYVRPSRKKGYDAVVSMWVTTEQFDAGFESKLFSDVKLWMRSAWPFEKTAYPGREISAAEFNQLPNKQ